MNRIMKSVLLDKAQDYRTKDLLSWSPTYRQPDASSPLGVWSIGHSTYNMGADITSHWPLNRVHHIGGDSTSGETTILGDWREAGLVQRGEAHEYCIFDGRHREKSKLYLCPSSSSLTWWKMEDFDQSRGLMNQRNQNTKHVELHFYRPSAMSAGPGGPVLKRTCKPLFCSHYNKNSNVLDWDLVSGTLLWLLLLCRKWSSRRGGAWRSRTLDFNPLFFELKKGY